MQVLTWADHPSNTDPMNVRVRNALMVGGPDMGTFGGLWVELQRSANKQPWEGSIYTYGVELKNFREWFTFGYYDFYYDGEIRVWDVGPFKFWRHW